MRSMEKALVGLAALALASCSVALGGPLALNLDGGNGTSQVDQYAGTSGSGWDTAWAARIYNPGITGTMTATVTSTAPLYAGGGNYLSTSINLARGLVSRRYSETNGSVDAALPHAIQFRYRVDSLSGDWATGGRPAVIVDGTGHSSGTGGNDTWYVQVTGEGGTWSGRGGSTGVPLVVGTTYDIIVMARPADNLYDLYVSDGTTKGVVLNSTFRRQDGNVGRYVHFGDDSNDGSSGSIESKSVEYSIDAIKILPATKVLVSTGCSWVHGPGWSDGSSPTSTTDAAIDNGGNAAIRTGDVSVKTLYLGATSSGSGIIAWRSGSTGDLHVYEDLVVGEDGTGTVRMTTNDATGKALDIDNHLYIGRRTGSTGTVNQDRGTVTVADNLLMGYETGSTGTYNLQGGTVNVRNAVEPESNSWIGVYGSGTVNHTAGTFSVTGNDLFLGYYNGSTGTYNLSGATSVVSLVDDFTVGNNGTGVFNQNGGDVTVRDTFVLGAGATGVGRYTLTDGTFLARNLNNAYAPIIGASGTGVFTQQGGSATFQSSVGMSLILGDGSSGDGTYEISGGALDAQLPMVVGSAGTGLFHIIGDDATINILSYVQGTNGTLELDVNGISPINVDGLVSLSGGLDIQFTAAPSPGDDFAIIINAGTDAVDGIFAGLPEGLMFYAPGCGIPVQITYVANVDGGSVGNDVLIHVTPEPATLTLLGFGGLAMLIRRRRRGRRVGRVVVLGLAAALILHAGVAKAQPYTLVWQTGGGSWPSNPDYWYDSGAVVFQVPTSVDDAIIDQGDAAVRNADCQAYNLILGSTSGRVGTVAWRAGNTRDLHVYNDFSVGSEGTGYVNMFAGQADEKTLDVDHYLYVGRSGSSRGYFTHQAGTVNVFVSLYVANSSGTQGTYTISGDAELTIDGFSGHRYLYVGNYGDAEFNQHGGTVTVGRFLRVAEGSTSDSTYTMTAGLLDLTPGYSIIIGRHGDGHFVQSGGRVDGPSNQGIYLGFDSDATGEWRLSGTGHVDAGGFLRVGCHGEGDFIQTGGSIDVPRDAVLGYSSDGDGVYEISGGTLDVDGSLIVGNAGTGLLKIIGDAATIDVDAYTQNALSTLELDVNGISPINVDDLVSLAGALDLEFLAPPSPGDDFPIIINTGDDLVEGFFAGLPEGQMFYVPGSDIPVQITYVANVDGGSVGNDVLIHVTPEPATLTMLGLGALGLVARRRRKG